jgi:hypothetical protein
MISGSQGFVVEGVINSSCHICKKTANRGLSALDVHILHFVESPLWFYQVDLHVRSWKLYLIGDKNISLCVHAHVAFSLFSRKVVFKKIISALLCYYIPS